MGGMGRDARHSGGAARLQDGSLAQREMNVAGSWENQDD